MIRFEKVTSDNFEDVINLKMKDSQIGFMENNLYSLAEAKVFDYLEPRAIYNDQELIGFMLYYFQPNGVVREMGPGEGVHEIHNDGMDYISTGLFIRRSRLTNMMQQLLQIQSWMLVLLLAMILSIVVSSIWVLLTIFISSHTTMAGRWKTSYTQYHMMPSIARVCSMLVLVHSRI